jgi:hypothetical protein
MIVTIDDPSLLECLVNVTRIVYDSETDTCAVTYDTGSIRIFKELTNRYKMEYVSPISVNVKDDWSFMAGAAHLFTLWFYVVCVVHELYLKYTINGQPYVISGSEDDIMKLCILCGITVP